MSLNKHDLDSFRRAKRQRAQKIDVLIIVLFLLVAFFISLDHPPPGPGAPAFHKSQSKQSAPPRDNPSVLARAPN